MNAVERLAELFRTARMAGGWTDEGVAALVLAELGLDEDGRPRTLEGEVLPPETGPAPEA
jgi:hypothetical protein